MNAFYKEVGQKLKVPLNHLYIAYVIFFLIIIGGLGIWISIYQENQKEKFDCLAVAVNICTYYIALSSTSIIDLQINNKFENRLSVNIYSFIISIVLGFIFWMIYQVIDFWAIFLACIGFMISIILWHLANSESDKFSDESYNKSVRKESAENHGRDWE
jgi:uncharacterized membrane protein